MVDFKKLLEGRAEDPDKRQASGTAFFVPRPPLLVELQALEKWYADDRKLFDDYVYNALMLVNAETCLTTEDKEDRDLAFKLDLMRDAGFSAMEMLVDLSHAKNPPVPAAPRSIEDAFTKKTPEELAREAAAVRAPEVELAPEQKWAAGEVMNEDVPVSVLTGAAGTGKSTIIRYLRDEHMVKVCATTGKAAMNIDGCTLDSLFHFSRDTWRFRSQEGLDKRMAACPKTILIDESSMIGMQMAALVAEAAEMYRKKIILVGDWGQARPVKDTWPMRSRLFANAQLIKLQQCHRQKDGEYLNALNRARVGQLTAEDSALFASRTQHEPPDRDFPGFCMFATNKTTDAYNAKCLDEHCVAHNVKKARFDTQFEDLRSDYLKAQYDLDEKRIAKLIDDCPFAHNEYFAVGCKVVITQNMDDLLFNGDVGRISELDPLTRTVVIDVQRQGYEFSFRMCQQQIESVDALGNVTARFKGFPIRLGYGVTIHKAQGMTVDRAWVDMASICYFPPGTRHGLAYVALSRTRTLEGLTLSGWNTEAVEVDDEIRPWL